jgi:S-adenosylmethionine synthetase
MIPVRVEWLHCPTVAEGPIEIVERKGVGHPDSICDGVAEYAAVQLAREYRRRAGRIAHFNLDKGMLAAGSAARWFGGGQLFEPLRLIVGDRATPEVDGIAIPVDQIVWDAARAWFAANLPRIDPSRDVVYQSELHVGSPELCATVDGAVGTSPANDTSAAVGYAPLSPTEQLVLRSERYLNGHEFKAGFPDTGEDVKVMAFRLEDQTRLTIAMPFLAENITSEAQYFRRKAEVLAALRAYLVGGPTAPANLDVELNSLDVPGRDVSGVYLSLFGTSAESGDSGEVGRGNRVNGLISLNRPASAEAAAGKNPVSHVGKLYNVLSFQLAEQIYDRVPGIREVTVWLGSQIGSPINRPAMAAAQIISAPGARDAAIARQVEEIVDDGVAKIGELSEALIDGRVRVY